MLAFFCLIVIPFFALQPSVHITVNIDEPSPYYVIYRYVSREHSSVQGKVTATHEQDADLTQKSTVTFETNYDPVFVTVVGEPYILDPGRWTFELTTPENIFVVSLYFP